MSSRFTAEERRSVAGATFTVTAAANLRLHVRSTARVLAYNRLLDHELRGRGRVGPASPRCRARTRGRGDLRLLPTAAVYALVAAVTHAWAAIKVRRLRLGWVTDSISRVRRGIAFATSMLDPGVWVPTRCGSSTTTATRTCGSAGSSPSVPVCASRRTCRSPTVSGSRLAEGVRIGERCSLWAGDRHGRIVVGEHTLFGPEVYVTASNYRTDRPGPVFDQLTDERDVHIGARTWLGRGVVVLPGVRIGAGTVVGAGSVVDRDLPEDVVAVGVRQAWCGRGSSPRTPVPDRASPRRSPNSRRRARQSPPRRLEDLAHRQHLVDAARDLAAHARTPASMSPPK